MACCEECGCFDDNWVDGEDITEEELEKDPMNPIRYYYWHGDIQEDYQMPKGYDVYANVDFMFLNAGEIIEKYEWKTNKLNPNWNDEEMGLVYTSLKSVTTFPHSFKNGVILKEVNKGALHATNTNRIKHDRGRNSSKQEFYFRTAHQLLQMYSEKDS